MASITLTTTPILIHTGPCEIIAIHKVTVLIIDPLGDNIEFALKDDFQYDGDKEVHAKALLAPSSTVGVTPITPGGGGDPNITTIVKTLSGDILASDFGANKFVRMDTASTTKTLTFTSAVISTLPIGSTTTIWKTGSGTLNLVRSGITIESAYGNVNLKLTGADGFLVFIYVTDTNKIHVIGPVEQ